MIRKILIAVAVAALAGCGMQDDNEKPIYDKAGLPINCRAYVQEAVDGYRSKKYTGDEAMDGLERNCGAAGHSWENMR